VLTALVTFEPLTMVAKEWGPLTPLSVLPFVIGANLVVVSWALHWRKINRDEITSDPPDWVPISGHLFKR
jgi:hypothetical protein